MSSSQSINYKLESKNKTARNTVYWKILVIIGHKTEKYICQNQNKKACFTRRNDRLCQQILDRSVFFINITIIDKIYVNYLSINVHRCISKKISYSYTHTHTQRITAWRRLPFIKVIYDVWPKMYKSKIKFYFQLFSGINKIRILSCSFVYLYLRLYYSHL